MSQKTSRINDVIYEIHRDITADLSGKKLADIAAYSEQHFHRVFHQEIGETVHQYVRRTRLEHAANQLMFDPRRPIQDIAEKCGFSSLSSFTHAFKGEFKQTPGQWRKRDKQSQKPILDKRIDKEIINAYETLENTELPVPEILTLPDQNVAYVRHQGYGRSIRQAWQVLQAWALVEERDFSQQFGLHHSNPAWVPLPQCRYVACLSVDAPIPRRGPVSSLTIPGGLHAAFQLTGKYGELLPYLSKIWEQWLPESGFKTQTTPAFAHYRKNHFINADEKFDLTFYLPITFI